MKVLYFAALRERMGRADESLPLPAGVATVGALQDWLRARDEAGAVAFQHGATVRAAVNQDFAHASTPVTDADEVAFFPPVTGG